MKRSAFTMLELVFVIVIMGIIGKFGVELLAQAYNNFIFNSINSSLQEKSQNAVEMIASRLQYRIKPSTIVRKSSNFTDYQPLSSDGDDSYTVLEWVGGAIDSFRGTTEPLWSGIIDLDNSTATLLDSPDTNTTTLSNLIYALSNGGSTIDNAAIYFHGSNTNYKGFGWDGNAITDQNLTMHPIKKDSTDISNFIPRVGGTTTTNTFSGHDIYEYYTLAWTAYAVELDPTSHVLTLWYDYQPWDGEKYTQGKHVTLMEDVSTFRYRAINSVIQIQVCTKSDFIEDINYSICKEKVVY